MSAIIHSISLIFLMIIVFVQSQINNEQGLISKNNEPQIPQLVKQFFAAEPNAQVYQLEFLPHHQPQSARQIVFYGPQGQGGQPILINPGNIPGNFLIPQAPITPNFIPRNNNPQNPTALFPNNARYPKPAHIPPINKDAEEVSTNPAKIPPLLRPVKSKGKAQGKPEKIETFTETTQQEDGANNNNNNRKENPFLLNPEQTSLRPGQRFFVLNGENIYNYPYEEETLSASPDQTFQILSPFAKAPPAQSATSSNLVQQLSIPNYIYRQSFAENQQETQQKNNEDILRNAQQYFRTAPVINREQPENFEINHQASSFINNPEELIEPQLVGHFKFSPNDLNNNHNQFQLTDDVENDAVVVEAINFDSSALAENQRLTSDREPNSKPLEVEPLEKDSESSMAEAGPQATAIAGPGGVAGSAPRATAIVGNGGLAISSPQATAVAGTTEEKKKTNTTKPEKETIN